VLVSLLLKLGLTQLFCCVSQVPQRPLALPWLVACRSRVGHPPCCTGCCDNAPPVMQPTGMFIYSIPGTTAGELSTSSPFPSPPHQSAAPATHTAWPGDAPTGPNASTYDGHSEPRPQQPCLHNASLTAQHRACLLYGTAPGDTLYRQSTSSCCLLIGCTRPKLAQAQLLRASKRENCCGL
jgi:hypothetical protein